ncbi:MAG: type II toxin-antitoxin system Phd/YefM family antitoxin [Kiloniellales bacterium]
MTNIVSAGDAATVLPLLLELVQQGEIVILTKSGRPVAKLVPFYTGPRRSQSATLRRSSVSLMATARPAFRSDAPA